MSQAFQSKYGITVEYHPDAGAGIFPRLNAERKAGLNLWDVLISGTSTALDWPAGKYGIADPDGVLLHLSE